MELILRSSDIGYLKNAAEAEKAHVFVTSKEKPVLTWTDFEELAPLAGGRDFIVVHETASRDMELFTLGGLLAGSGASFTTVNFALPKEVADKYKERLKNVTWNAKQNGKATKKSSRKKTTKTTLAPTESSIGDTISSEKSEAGAESANDDGDVP